MESIWKRIAKMFGYVMLIVGWIGFTIPVYIYGFVYGVVTLWHEKVNEGNMNAVVAMVMTPAIGILSGFGMIHGLWFDALPIVLKAEDSI